MTTAFKLRIVDPPMFAIHVSDSPGPPVHIFDDVDIPPFPIPTLFKNAGFGSVASLAATVSWVTGSAASFSGIVFAQLLARVAHDWVIAPDVALSVLAAQAESVNVGASVVLSADAGSTHEVAGSAAVELTADVEAIALVVAPLGLTATLSAAVVQFGGTTTATASFVGTATLSATAVPAANVPASFGADVTLTAVTHSVVAAPFTAGTVLSSAAAIPLAANFSTVANLVAFAEQPTTYPATSLYPSEGVYPSEQLVWALVAAFEPSAALSASAYVSVARAAGFTSTVALSAVVSSATAPMGLDKSGNYELPGGSGDWVVIPAWSTRSGYPDTAASGNGFEVNGGGSVTVTARITWGGTSGSDYGVRVMKNGALVQSYTETATGSVVNLTTSSFSVSGGDIITLEGMHNSIGSTTRTVRAGASNTFFYLTPA